MSLPLLLTEVRACAVCADLPLGPRPVLSAGRGAPVVLIGMYAQKRYLGRERRKTLTETVREGASYGPKLVPVPHPSWRARMWMAKNPWFEADVLPPLRTRVAGLIAPR